MVTQRKVLFIATIASHIKGFHEPYLKLFHDNGYKVYVASKNNLSSNDVINYCDEFIEISIERSPIKINNIKAILQLKKNLEKEKFDIIHCHTPMGSVVARIAARKARKKYGTRVIYTAHGFHFYKGAPKKNWIIFYPIERWLSKYTDTLITINKEDFDLAKIKLSKRCHDIQYVPGVGIDTKRFNIKLTDVQEKEYRKSLGLKNSDFVLSCVARLDKNKSQDFLINVIEYLLKKYDDIHLLLAGRDELNGFYQKLAKEKNIDKYVHFLGNRDDIPELLSISNVVVSASKREGLPVNVMEAFASGKPVVALDCRGMKDLIMDGKNGFIVSRNIDSVLQSFAADILKIKNNKCKFKIECDKYDLNNIINDYSNIYFIK